MKKTKLLTLTLLTALLIMSWTTLSAFATTVPTFTVSPLSTSQVPVVLPTGTTFNGSISVTGTVRFWVSDPNGAQIVNLGLIDNTAKFSFVSQQNGNYTMNFENDQPNADPVQVTLSFVTNPDISAGNSTGTPLIYFIILVVIAVVGSILIIFLVRRKNKNRASTG
jgi:hypothetical protein